VTLRPLQFVLGLLSLTLAAQAGEFAVLSNGFRIHADSHTVDGSLIRLQTNQGVIEIPANTVASFEQEDYKAPAAPPSAAPPPAPVHPSLTPQELINQAAVHAGLPPAIVRSIARAESGFHQGAVSPKGAIGLMQLMPGTAAALNADLIRWIPRKTPKPARNTCAICSRNTRTIRTRSPKPWPPTMPVQGPSINITASRLMPRPSDT